LEFLGLVEKERRLFISYRQSDSRVISDQLHTSLVQSRFNVFLDRFSVAPGVDFRERIDDELSDKAFLLLLETRQAGASPWVHHEIAYALANHIPVFVLTLPDVSSSQQVKNIDEAFRFGLSDKDISTDGKLTAKTISEIVERIEIEHARAIYRRREQILGSVTENLRLDGCSCSQISDWSIVASKSNGHAGIFLITPRRPEPLDFYILSNQYQCLRSSSDLQNLKSSVVHNTETVDSERSRVIDWLSCISGSEINTIASCSV